MTRAHYVILSEAKNLFRATALEVLQSQKALLQDDIAFRVPHASSRAFGIADVSNSKRARTPAVHTGSFSA